MIDLLPPNASALERAIAATGARVDALPVNLRHLWSPTLCPVGLLPWLAWSLAVDEWESHWDESTQRRVIAGAIEIHRRRGTAAAMRQAIQSAGYANAEIKEGEPQMSYNGSTLHDASETYAGGARWALFSVNADLEETQGVDSNTYHRLQRAINRNKPVGRHLKDIRFRAPVTDTATLDDAVVATVTTAAADNYDWGFTYDGQCKYNQALKVSSQNPVQFDGSYRYGATADHSGSISSVNWQEQGAALRHNNWRDNIKELKAGVDLGDRIDTDLLHDQRALYNGAHRHSARSAGAQDAISITTRRTNRHIGQYRYNGSLRHTTTITQLGA